MMRIARSTFLLLLCLLPALLPAAAEDKFGVPVYAGAKYDAETSAFVVQMGGQAACYQSATILRRWWLSTANSLASSSSTPAQRARCSSSTE